MHKKEFKHLISKCSRRRYGANNPTKRFFPFIALLLLFVFIGGWMAFSESSPLSPTCFFKQLTGVPCPGCGGTRAFRLLLQGEIGKALYTNPLSVGVILFLILSLFWLFIDCFRQTRTLKKFLTTPPRLPYLLALLLILLINWIWNIHKDL